MKRTAFPTDNYSLRIMTTLFNILFLCRDNAALSIIAEACANAISHDRFHAYSAGAQPADCVHPLAIELIASYHLDYAGLRSKHWSEFSQSDAPQLDFIIALCDKDAGQICPSFPGHPLMAQWNITDPLAASPEKMPAMFVKAGRELDTRIRLLNCLPMRGFIQRKQEMDAHYR